MSESGYCSHHEDGLDQAGQGSFIALVREAEGGEHVVITRNGQRVAQLVPFTPRKGGLNFEALRKWKKERGIDKIFGDIPDDFDDPLPEDFLIRPMTDVGQA